MLRRYAVGAAVVATIASVAVCAGPAAAQFGPPPIPMGGPPHIPMAGPPQGLAGGPPRGLAPQGLAGGPQHGAAPQGLAGGQPRFAGGASRVAPHGAAPQGLASRSLHPEGLAGHSADNRFATARSFGRGDFSRGSAGRDVASARAASATRFDGRYGGGYDGRKSGGYAERFARGYDQRYGSSYARSYRDEWSNYRRDHYGYDRWGRSRYWAYAYADLLGYALTSESSSNQGSSYSYDDNSYSYSGSYAAAESGYGNASARSGAGGASQYSAGAAAASGPVASAAPRTDTTPPSASGDTLCEAAAQSLSSSATIEQVAKAVQPTGAQVAKLEALRSVLENTEKDLAASCAAQAPLTAVGRLDAAGTGLEAMVKATEAVSGPLDDFYASLTDEQKAAFNALGAKDGQERLGAADHPDLAQLCDPQNEVPLVPPDNIAKAVQPDARQQAALAALGDATGKAQRMIQAACPVRLPMTPPARLGAVHNQLQAMLHGVEQMRPALQAFYGSLSDEQKARFDVATQLPAPSEQNAKS